MDTTTLLMQASLKSTILFLKNKQEIIQITCTVVEKLLEDMEKKGTEVTEAEKQEFTRKLELTAELLKSC